MKHESGKIILEGVGGSHGIAEGIVKVVSGVKDAPYFKEGCKVFLVIKNS